MMLTLLIDRQVAGVKMYHHLIARFNLSRVGFAWFVD
jgi:hypothetical protein